MCHRSHKFAAPCAYFSWIQFGSENSCAGPALAERVGNIDMKAQRIAGAVFAALIVVVAAALLFGIPSSLLSSAIEARLQRETGYRIAVAGAARLGVWPELRVMLHDVTFSNPNDSNVSGGLTVERIEASLPWQGVLSGQLHVSE